MSTDTLGTMESTSSIADRRTIISQQIEELQVQERNLLVENYRDKLTRMLGEKKTAEDNLKAIEKEIREFKRTNKNALKDPNNGVKRHKGKGFGEFKVEDLILTSLSPNGSRMTDIVDQIKNSVDYDGNPDSISPTIGGKLKKMVEDGVIKKIKHGLYAPIFTESSHEDEVPENTDEWNPDPNVDPDPNVE